MCVSFCIKIHFYFTRIGIDGSYGQWVFNFIRNCPAVCQSGRAILHSHQQLVSFSNSTFSLTLYIIRLCYLPITLGVELYLIILIYTFLMMLVLGDLGLFVLLFVALLWGIVCSNICFFEKIELIFILLRILYIFWIPVFYQTCDL